jgi:hypothetical protein
MGLVSDPVTMRVTYGAADSTHCRTVSVDFTEWPYGSAREATTIAIVEPILEGLCTPL